MRALVVCLLVLFAGAAQAQPSGQRFVAIAFHDVVDRQEDLKYDSVTAETLVRFFDWLKGTGWTAISLDDLAAAARGTRPLPDKAILITFDDGFHSVYTRVYPLLKVYRYPIVSALVGSWMEGPAGGSVFYGDRLAPRTTFISWAEAREMQGSGLVEFASHSYAMHQGILANPQGNLIPAAITWRYDAASGRYEDDPQYRARVRGDLERSRRLMAAQLGRAPRAIVWPFGRYSGLALAEAKSLGFSFAVTLEPEPAYSGDLLAIHRYYVSRNPELGVIAANLRFDPPYPETRRIACVSLDKVAAAGGGAQDAVLGGLIEALRALGANTVVIDAHAALAAPGAPLGEVYFPTNLRPMRADLLSHAVWQIRSRGGAEVFLRLPLDSAVAAVGEPAVPTLFADMVRHSAADGVLLEAPGGAGGSIVAEQPEAIRARRAARDPATLDPRSRLALAAYRGAAAIDPRLRLMLALPAPGGPPDWADIGLLPVPPDVAATAAVAGRLKAEGWLRPDVAGRVALALPVSPNQQVEALRRAQRLGASAFALCPQMPALPPSAALSAAFSSATYPYRP